MPTTTPTDKNDSHRSSAAQDLIGGLRFYIDIGLDDRGRAHFLEESEHEIVVTATDRRGKGVRNDDIEERISIPDGRTVDDYCAFVADDVEDLEWVECGWRPAVV